MQVRLPLVVCLLWVLAEGSLRAAASITFHSAHQHATLLALASDPSGTLCLPWVQATKQHVQQG